MENSALVIGGNSEIAQAIVHKLLESRHAEQIVSVSRGEKPHPLPDIGWYQSDYSEASLSEIVALITAARYRFDRVFICLGVLHDDKVSPEKRLEDLNADAMQHVIGINAILPMLWLKHLLPVLKESPSCHVAVFSARVGSITDNLYGGWYSYRASKAALNMYLKSAAIEYARRAPNVKLLAFHPGTTDTSLSRPFSKNVPEDKLFSPEFVADQLVSNMTRYQTNGEVSFIDWQFKPIDW